MTRAWFRRRLDAEPRRWVLFLAALEGLAAFALSSADRGMHESGVKLLVGLAFLAVAPAGGVAGMFAHGRLVLWGGRLLGGRARPHEIHAAFAWSQVSFVAAAFPLVAAIPLRLWLDPTGHGETFAADLLRSSAEPLTFAASLAAIWSGVLYVKYVAEVQGFGFGRALASHVLGVLTALVLLAAGLGLAFWLAPAWTGLTKGAAGLFVGLALGAVTEWATGHLPRRAAPAA